MDFCCKDLHWQRQHACRVQIRRKTGRGFALDACGCIDWGNYDELYVSLHGDTVSYILQCDAGGQRSTILRIIVCTSSIVPVLPRNALEIKSSIFVKCVPHFTHVYIYPPFKCSTNNIPIYFATEVCFNRNWRKIWWCWVMLGCADEVVWDFYSQNWIFLLIRKKKSENPC